MTLFNTAVLFCAKVLDNALSTGKTIFIQRNRWLIAGVTVILSDFIYFWVTKKVVSASGIGAMLTVALAGGAGCMLACLLSEKLSKDRTYVHVILSDDREAMQALRDYLAQNRITNMACDSYTRDWSKKTVSVTAYPETKAESRLIRDYIEGSRLKCKQVIQKQ